MDYKEVKEKLTATKRKFGEILENPNLPIEEKEKLQNIIFNYEYIIELADINNFNRGK